MMLGVFVNFLFYTDPPHIVDFGKVHEEGNAFSVNVTVHMPRRDEFVLQVVHNQSNTYTLGRLEAGEYAFRVYVQTVHEAVNIGLRGRSSLQFTNHPILQRCQAAATCWFY